MDQAEEYVRRILKVLIYIEEHIDEKMTMKELAKAASYSVFHFARVFHMVTGESAYQYVKRLRMQRAAGRLRYTEQPVTEIALDSTYDTPSAFTKAFKQWIGKSPRGYRTLHTSIQNMKKKIKELPMFTPDKIAKNSPDLNVLFIRRYGNYNKSGWDAWSAMSSFMTDNHLDRSKLRCFGINRDAPSVTSEDKLRYDACILASQEVKEKGEVARQIIKGGKYAVFTHPGSYDGLEDTFNRIFLKWLPESREQFDDSRTVFCEYLHMEYVKTHPEKLVTKLYIPLV